MKKTDLKRHLNIYSIYKKRHTTINHAFASAISYFDNYDEAAVKIALRLLDQNPNSDLKCVYCNKKAESWDHLKALVNDGNFTGNGHQLGNLVPCCRKCNSSKGRKDYIDFLQVIEINEDFKKDKLNMLQNYVSSFKNNVIDINSTEYMEVTQEYNKIKNQIFSLMKLADIEAQKIRDHYSN